MCTKASLSALIGASSGTIKVAYCTDAYLVVLTNKVDGSFLPGVPGCCKECLLPTY